MASRGMFLLSVVLLLSGSVCLGGDTQNLPDGVTDQWLKKVKSHIQSDLPRSSENFTPTTSGWIAEGDRFYAHFGACIAPAGDVNGDGYSDIIIGAPEFWEDDFVKPGKAWVFLGGRTGLDTTPCWSALGEFHEDEFGKTVASAGDVNGDGYDEIIVGAPERTGGKVYVYYGSVDGPSVVEDWYDNRGYSMSRYAFSVATAGDVNGDGYADILVGDPYENDLDGAVWLYYGSSVGLDRDDHLTHYGHEGAYLGWSVSTAGDIDADGLADWVAGAWRDEYNSGLDQPGAVLIAYGNGTTEYFRGDINFRGFGWEVSLAGDVDGDGYADVLISSQRNFPPMSSVVSQTKLYCGTADGLSSTPSWTMENTDEPGEGFRVATAGDVNGDGYADVLLACGFLDVGAYTDNGQAGLFLGSKNGLDMDPVWTEDINQNDALLGAIATAGDVNGDGYSDILVGAPKFDGAETNCGRVECFLGGGEGVAQDHDWIAESDHPNALFGWSVASAGDVNGDGFDDVLIGAPFDYEDELGEGIAYLFHGAANGLNWLPAWTAQGEQAQAGFGASVSSAGDVNGDGYADILIGAPYMDNTAALEGAVFVWLGQRHSMPDGTPSNADWSFYSGQEHSWFGFSVACAGDVNGDGLSDILVGAPNYDAGTIDEGAVFVFHGRTSGLGATHDWFHDTAKADCDYGASVASAGDMNGDGFSDIIVGAPSYDHPQNSVGLAFVYIGSESGLLPGAPWWYASGVEEGGEFGFSVASAGDVNGDGFSDVIVGAPYHDSSVIDSGLCYSWYGGSMAPPTGNPGNADWAIAFPGEVGLGHAVSSAGDVNNDGFSDVIVGAPFGDGMESRAGWVMTFRGSENGLETTHDSWIFGDRVNSKIGWALASAGDVTGDGFCDILIGAPYLTNGHSEEGRAFQHSGGGGEGILRQPRQLMSDLHTPLGPLNRSDSLTSFGLELQARSAAGRESVRMDYEIRGIGEDFSQPNFLYLVWLDTGAPTWDGSMIEIEQAISELSEDAQYKWRMCSRSRNPYFPRSPWFTLTRNGLGEADFRTRSPFSAVGVGPVPLAGPSVSCFPNPFNPSTTIRYVLSESGHTRLRVFDIGGRVIADLVDDDLPAGEYQIKWNGRDRNEFPVASGLYFYRLESGGVVASGRAVLVR